MTQSGRLQIEFVRRVDHSLGRERASNQQIAIIEDGRDAGSASTSWPLLLGWASRSASV
jgi:hypothetical protein